MISFYDMLNHRSKPRESQPDTAHENEDGDFSHEAYSPPQPERFAAREERTVFNERPTTPHSNPVYSPQAPTTATSPPPAFESATPSMATQATARPSATLRGATYLERPPPLPGVPESWLLEVQRIVFHLLGRDEQRGQSLMFTGIGPGVGTTTISYLVAHHLACEGSNRRVLFAEFRPEFANAENTSNHATVALGEPIPGEFWQAPRSLTVLSIRAGHNIQSVGDKTRWFREFVTQSREHFDHLIVDAPTFSRASEGYAIAKASDGVILVLKSGDRYPAVNALVNDLNRLGIRVQGAVLNFRDYPVPRWLLRYI